MENWLGKHTIEMKIDIYLLEKAFKRLYALQNCKITVGLSRSLATYLSKYCFFTPRHFNQFVPVKTF